jgi:hypothetical protein
MQDLDEVARRIWVCDWQTIVSVGAMAPRERDALQATIRKKYGKVLDLTEKPHRIRDAVVAAYR